MCPWCPDSAAVRVSGERLPGIPESQRELMKSTLTIPSVEKLQAALKPRHL